MMAALDEKMEDLYRHLKMPPELAVEFMATFSRAEHALKSTSYVNGSEGAVSPAWDKFVNEIHEEFELLTDETIIQV